VICFRTDSAGIPEAINSKISAYPKSRWNPYSDFSRRDWNKEREKLRLTVMWRLSPPAFHEQRRCGSFRTIRAAMWENSTKDVTDVVQGRFLTMKKIA
jgi:hypothetical protein